MTTATAKKRSKPKKKLFRLMSPEEQAAALETNRVELKRYFDINYLKNLNNQIIDFLKMYFRPQFIGFEEMPDRKENGSPLIYACNHSGMAFPWDAIMLGSGIYSLHNYDLERLFRPLAAPALSASNLMNPFLLRNMWKRVGAMDASTLNFETMMKYSRSNVLIYPEGIPGIGKGFNRRYQLQTFSTSMIRMAIKYKTDIIGISCVNGEYINPLSYSWRWLNKQVNKIGVPYLPVALQTPLLLIQPWTFYYAWPAKLTYVVGRRYSPFKLAGEREIDELSEEEIAMVRDQVQTDMQKHLNESVKAYGKKPYQWREVIRNLFRYGRHLPYWTPMGWPALFSEFDRRYGAEPKPPQNITRGWFHFWYIVWRNPIILAYFIPILGWIPILYRGMRGRKEAPIWEGSHI